MANVDKPMGAKPVQHLDGSPYNGKYNIYYIPATDNTATFMYDWVKPAGSADTTGKYPTVAQAAATDATLLGTIVGFGTTPQLMANPTNLSMNYRAAATAMYVAVADAPDLIFEMQENGESDPLAVADVGNNIDIIVGSGNTSSGMSAMEIDSDNYSEGTGTAQLRLLRVAPREDNDLGAHCKWWVIPNEHVYKTTTGT